MSEVPINEMEQISRTITNRHETPHEYASKNGTTGKQVGNRCLMTRVAGVSAAGIDNNDNNKEWRVTHS